MAFQKRNKKKILQIGIAVAVCVCVIGGGTLFAMKKSEKAVKVAPVASMSNGGWYSESDIYDYAKVQAGASQDIYHDDTLTIKEIYVKAGDTVKIGDRLVAYDTTLAGLEREMKQMEIQGIELNILDFDGTIDMDEAVLQRLDLAIASLHMPCIKPGTKKENTQAFLKVMENPYVDIIGHPGDPRYAVDYRELFRMAKETGTLLEINNASLTPGGFREGSRENIKKILLMSMEEGQPVVLGSDAHFYRNVGDFSYAEDLLRELQFPEELILNNTPEKFLAGLRHGRK